MMHWRALVGDTNYAAEIAGARIRFTKDQGTPESFGQNDVPFPRFVRSAKWHSHVRDIFGPEVLAEMLAIASEPTTGNRAV
jgi:hypothetical protein